MSEILNDDRLPQKPIKNVAELCEKVKSYHPTAPVHIIEKAYEFSEKAHEGQLRRSGEPYISHPLNVAGILADLKLDIDTIVTGLLHDTVEDTEVTLEDIKREFGDTVASLVDGVTKIGQMNFRNSFEKQGENIRKMIIAMGKDVRVVLVKLCDRLHNIRTLNHMPYEKQERIAQETLEIYCPLAGRIGISALKIELEDLCFRYSRPDKYYELVQTIKKTEHETQRYIEEVKKSVTDSLAKSTIKNFKIYGRSKHLWSIYRKMTARNLTYDQIYDVLAFRIIVNTVVECYEALGYIHSIWKPIPGRFKDFIAMPKSNNYQSLHTTVIGPGGDRIEIQIRTEEMHLIAEKGIAAHWNYKERGNLNQEELNKANWLRDLVALNQSGDAPDEFLDTIKTGLAEKDIYVFTPKGDVIELPDQATPVDLAYAIHTNLGGMCTGARVNGRMVPLKHHLENGDRVEILTSKTQTPSKDWLKFVVTTKAKSRIRQFVKEEQRRNAIVMGKDIVEKEFRKFGMAAAKYLKGPEFDKYMKESGIVDLEELYARVGYGKFEPNLLVKNLSPEAIQKEAEKTPDSTIMERLVKSAKAKMRRTNSIIAVDGMDDVLVHFAKCCSPIPGDPITGFISRGKGIIVHRSSCKKVFENDQIRRVDVEWTSKSAQDGQERQVKLEVISQDIQGLLKLMTESFASQGINIDSAQIRTTRDKKAVCLFEISVKDVAQLSNAVLSLQKIKGVINVQRISG
ncbi:RelA/SpoT family protein [Pseudobdellovibrio exovorus]|uniref:GTP pyrophosphokinase n=1 Tax=Pseudobdellovibrio exovorus JSS TaxID=1184267 RepID=M4V8M4_9BACT|nr:bifunctional (p)ppGpp synthetase/guanosine-3',5'-bis(diphosphate) 3'-pyrophosphohydrolase [Pseudobdellovibrio exovorus]AGH95752.1 GTP pyrophosphokinase [Pseudobdellovibrio exovorus JSS]